MKKLLLLIGILLIPAMVFLFLHNFGENKYTIPVFYSDAKELPKSGCLGITAPYAVAPFTYTLLGNDSKIESSASWSGKATLLAVLEDNCNACAAQVAMERAYRAVERGTDLQLKGIFVGQVNNNKVTTPKWEAIRLPENASEVLQCSLLLPSSDSLVYKAKANQLVLLDGKARIRGYYDASDRKETDRLIQEIQILSKE